MSVEIYDSIHEFQKARQGIGAEQVAFVPTMGALHDGHTALIRHARSLAPRVVVSIFVNPLQFGTGEDFSRYPRPLNRDIEAAESAGATDILVPTAEDLTPTNITVTVDPGPMGEVLCGAFRPGHFRGVCTIVAKLFNIVAPAHAVFGWKDAQQFLILRRMVRDLNLNVAMHALETVREPDGLARSSRNAYLSAGERAVAPEIFRLLAVTKDQILRNNPDSISDIMESLRQQLAALPQAKLQYADFVDLDSLQPATTLERNNRMVAVALKFPSARLIDNVRL